MRAITAIFFLATLLFPVCVEAAPEVLFYIYDHTEDHINVGSGTTLGPAEERWYDVLGSIKTAQTNHPLASLDNGPWLSLQFHGWEAEIHQTRNSLTKRARGEGLRDYLRRAEREGWLDVGYHGAHEPTYWNNAFTGLPTISTVSWATVQDLSEEWLSCRTRPVDGVYRGDRANPQSGPLTNVSGCPSADLDPYRGYCEWAQYCGDGRGGLDAVAGRLLGQSRPATGIRVVSGLGGAMTLPVGALALDGHVKSDTKGGTLGFGLDDHGGLPSPATDLCGYCGYVRAARTVLETLSEPAPDGAPGRTVYGLHSDGDRIVTSLIPSGEANCSACGISDTGPGFGRLTPHAGQDISDELNRRIALVPQDRPSIAKVHLLTKAAYFKAEGVYTCGGRSIVCESPTNLAYNCPDSPLMSSHVECKQSEDYRDDYLIRLWELLDSIGSTVEANVGNGTRIVSPRSLFAHTKSSLWGATIPTSSLATAVSTLLVKFSLPLVIWVENEPLSLADLFQGLVDSLDAYKNAGSVPSSVTVKRSRGSVHFLTPTELTSRGIRTEGTLSGMEILEGASSLSDRFELGVATPSDPLALFAPPASVDLVPDHATGMLRGVTTSGMLMGMAQVLVELAAGRPVPSLVRTENASLENAAILFARGSILREEQLWRWKPVLLSR